MCNLEGVLPASEYYWGRYELQSLREVARSSCNGWKQYRASMKAAAMRSPVVLTTLY